MKFLLTLLTSFCAVISYSQQTINGSIEHDGIQRTYILYVPATYSVSTPAPLVLNFHGYTSNSTEQMFYGDFRSISDTAGFLIVHPMGTLDGSNEPYWNAAMGGSVDDLGFASALIDSLSAEYSINQDRIYSTGMSNGGFMSYYLACELGNKIAAIASVTGSMNFGTFVGCNPSHPVPVMEIHGTADAVVNYNGSTGVKSIAEVMTYWVNFNNCTSAPVITAVPNTSTTDNCAAEHYLYSNGTNGVDVEHYKIINGGHTWPGAPIEIGTTNYDINASLKIWEFFSKYDKNGKILGNELIEPELDISISPNPVQDQLNIVIPGESLVEYSITDVSGNIILEGQADNSAINVSKFTSGVYLLYLKIEGQIRSVKFVKE